MTSSTSFPLSPDLLYGQLYFDIQLVHVFSDTKTVVDYVPDVSPSEIVVLYEHDKILSDFNFVAVVNKHFHLPSFPALAYTSYSIIALKDHVNNLWDFLSRPTDTPTEDSSKIPLPFPYIVPGGRFQEIFYWDSYFTMLGLILTSERLYIMRGIIDNFICMIDGFCFIPNGSSTYFLSRSQLPFFTEMI
ncbi:unnamed protein product [Rotaria sp. Silwood2]|nr:unnamed protein product [Rotaria sp. Silwood2]